MYGIPLNSFSPAVREYPSSTSPKIEIYIDFSYMVCSAAKQTVQREQTSRKKRYTEHIIFQILLLPLPFLPHKYRAHIHALKLSIF